MGMIRPRILPDENPATFCHLLGHNSQKIHLLVCGNEGLTAAGSPGEIVVKWVENMGHGDLLQYAGWKPALSR